MSIVEEIEDVILGVRIKNPEDIGKQVLQAVQDLRPGHYQCSTFTISALSKQDILQEDPYRDEAVLWVSSAAPASVQLCHTDAEANDAIRGNVTGAVLALANGSVVLRGTAKLWAVASAGQACQVSIVATRRG